MEEKLTALQKENKRLETAINELSVLNDVATAISSTQSVESVIEQIVLRCIKHLKVEQGTVQLLSEQESEQNFQTMIRKQDSSKVVLPYRLDSQLIGWMLKNKRPLLVNDIFNDDRFKLTKHDEIPFKSLLSAPMMVKGKLTGLLTIFNKKNDEHFIEEDKRLLSIIAAQSAQIIENARLYEEEKMLLSLKEEMRLAHDIQMNLLPKDSPKIENYSIQALSIPAKEVGGDYFDFINFESGKLGFCVGDISGKGIPAAMLMSNLQAAIRSTSLVQLDCAKCVEITNKLLYNTTESNRFATLFYGVLDSNNHTVEYCNGGHDQPIIIKRNASHSGLDSTGLIVGVFEETTFGKAIVKLEPGDQLFIYTDGVTEAMNPNDEEFGMDKMISVLEHNKEKNTEEILESLSIAIREHTAGQPQSDDITMMMIKREK
jgi:sigma-B regulation protein RsbU (phosphoserine phosphatase)